MLGNLRAINPHFWHFQIFHWVHMLCSTWCYCHSLSAEEISRSLLHLVLEIIGLKVSLTFHPNLPFDAFSINLLLDFHSSWPPFSLFLGTIHKHYWGGGAGGFVIFIDKIWEPSSHLPPPFEYWQNLGAPFLRIGRTRYPLYIWFVNNTPVCDIWPYVSYFSFWEYLGAALPPSDKWQNLGTTSQKPHPP